MELILKDDEGRVIHTFPFSFPTKQEWEETLNPEISGFDPSAGYFELKIDFYSDLNSNAERQGAYFRRIGIFEESGRVEFSDTSKFDSGDYLEEIEDRQPEEESPAQAEEESPAQAEENTSKELESFRKQLRRFARNSDLKKKFEPYREQAKQLLTLSNEDLKKWIIENGVGNFDLYVVENGSKGRKPKF